MAVHRRHARGAVAVALVLALALVALLGRTLGVGGGAGPSALDGPSDDGSSSGAPAPDVEEEDAWSGYAYTAWDEQESPNYVRLVGEAHIEEPLAAGEVSYSELDELGRTGQVRACITSQMMREGEARERADSLPNPSGWPETNQEVPLELPSGGTTSTWFWNRCHLLAKSLGGSDGQENLVTGTRLFNVGAGNGQGGMDLFETAIRDWLGTYPDVTIQYVATPLYEDDELIPRSVVVDVLSSDGAINEELEVYNCAKGFRIDYHDGSFWQEA